jgi:hypothetical protein
MICSAGRLIEKWKDQRFGVTHLYHRVYVLLYNRRSFEIVPTAFRASHGPSQQLQQRKGIWIPSQVNGWFIMHLWHLLPCKPLEADIAAFSECRAIKIRHRSFKLPS